MATEKLIVELDAETGSLDAALESSSDKMDDLDEKTTKTDVSLKGLGVAAKNAAVGVAGVGTAVIAAAGAISTMVVMAGKNRMELEQLARQTKLSVEEFSQLAFATRQFGVDGENIADISKDISDKMGEFGRVGTGAFQDIADILGMTKEEAQAMAISMEDMSSEQVIGTLIKRMEDAGASSNEMTFALESMGNDLSKLLPLFASNGEELSKLKGQYSSATSAMKLTREEANELKGAAVSFDLLTSSLGSLSTKVSAELAPEITSFFKELTSIIPLVTEDLTSFINRFRDAENISSLSDINDQIASTREELVGWNNEKQGWSPFLSDDQIDKHIEVNQSRLDELLKQKSELEKPSVNNKDKPDSGGGGGEGDSRGDIMARIIANNMALEKERQDSANAAAIAAIESRFKTEKELLDERLAEELNTVQGNNELKLSLEEEHRDAIVQLEKDAIDKENTMKDKDNAADQKRLDKASKASKKEIDRQIANEEGFLSAAQSINGAFLDDNKAVGAGIIVADTAIGFQKALAQGGGLGWGQAAAIAASGTAQLANLASASRGGGSISGGSAPTDIPITNAPEDDVSVLASDAGGAGAGEIVIRFEGNGDDVTEAIAKNITVMERNGTLA